MQPIQLCFDGSGTYKTAFSLGNMGTQALKSHATGKGNFKKVKEQRYATFSQKDIIQIK